MAWADKTLEEKIDSVHEHQVVIAVAAIGLAVTGVWLALRGNRDVDERMDRLDEELAYHYWRGF